MFRVKALWRMICVLSGLAVITIILPILKQRVVVNSAAKFLPRSNNHRIKFQSLYHNNHGNSSTSNGLYTRYVLNIHKPGIHGKPISRGTLGNQDDVRNRENQGIYNDQMIYDNLRTNSNHIFQDKPIKHDHSSGNPSANDNLSIHNNLGIHENPSINEKTIIHEDLSSNDNLSDIGYELPSGYNIFQESDHSAVKFRKIRNLDKVLQNYTDSYGRILIAYVEYGYIELAMNFYITSLRRFYITNYAIISSDKRSCKYLRRRDVNCIHFKSSVLGGGDASTYGSLEYIMKTYMKTHLVINALELNYTVILCDLDIVFLQNPMPHLIEQSRNADLVMSINGIKQTINSGFYIVKPSTETRFFFQKLWQLEIQMQNVTEQYIMIPLLEQYKDHIRLRYLDIHSFVPGDMYWEEGKIMFIYEDPWNSTKLSDFKPIVIHNNWIWTKSGKIYRFKESLMWHYDEHGYYSDDSRKYLTYDNHDVSLKIRPGTYQSIEIAALIDALSIGYLLNRTVILPSFHCFALCSSGACQNSEGRCAFNVRNKVEDLDMYFKDCYREHVFLNHPLVPSSIKRSQSEIFLIQSNFVKKSKILENRVHKSASGILAYEPQDVSHGASVEEIVKWFGDRPENVLRFHSLYRAFRGFPNYGKYTSIRQSLSRAITVTNYRQNFRDKLLS